MRFRHEAVVVRLGDEQPELVGRGKLVRPLHAQRRGEAVVSQTVRYRFDVRFVPRLVHDENRLTSADRHVVRASKPGVRAVFHPSEQLRGPIVGVLHPLILELAALGLLSGVRFLVGAVDTRGRGGLDVFFDLLGLLLGWVVERSDSLQEHVLFLGIIALPIHGGPVGEIGRGQSCPDDLPLVYRAGEPSTFGLRDRRIHRRAVAVLKLVGRVVGVSAFDPLGGGIDFRSNALGFFLRPTFGERIVARLVDHVNLAVVLLVVDSESRLGLFDLVGIEAVLVYVVVAVNPGFRVVFVNPRGQHHAEISTVDLVVEEDRELASHDDLDVAERPAVGTHVVVQILH